MTNPSVGGVATLLFGTIHKIVEHLIVVHFPETYISLLLQGTNVSHHLKELL